MESINRKIELERLKELHRLQANAIHRFDIFPGLGAFSRGKSYVMLEKIILEDIDSFIGYGFEDVCRHFLKDLNYKNQLPFGFNRIETWWHKDEEIDILALDGESKNMLFVECK